MLFFLDENFPKKAVPFLNEKGHETLDIRGTPQEGLEDSLIFALAQEKGAVFLTPTGISSIRFRSSTTTITASSSLP